MKASLSLTPILLLSLAGAMAYCILSGPCQFKRTSVGSCRALPTTAQMQETAKTATQAESRTTPPDAGAAVHLRLPPPPPQRTTFGDNKPGAGTKAGSAPRSTRSAKEPQSPGFERSLRTVSEGGGAKAFNSEPPGPLDLSRPEIERRGAALLRLAEIDATTEIEIAWPESEAETNALFHAFHRCLGMRLANFEAGRGLQIEGGGDPELYSGLVRFSRGRLGVEERRMLRRSELHGGQPARVYPRPLDARLLGGLTEIFGVSRLSGPLTGRYRLQGGKLLVTQLVLDGTAARRPLLLADLDGQACQKPVR